VPNSYRSVLLVDDDRLILDLYAIALRNHGYTVHTASDAASARAIAEATSPTLVCVDGRLNSASGKDLATELHDSGYQVVIFTNDQALYDRPPRGVTNRLIKVNTPPQELGPHLDRVLAGHPVP
jgi:DNA-binding NtrC family response regulator